MGDIVRDQIKGIDRLNESQKMIIPDSSICRDVIAMARDKKIPSLFMTIHPKQNSAYVADIFVSFIVVVGILNFDECRLSNASDAPNVSSEDSNWSGLGGLSWLGLAL